MARIYDRADLDSGEVLPALYVTGALPNAKPSLAYEGRLQIHNAADACRAELWDGTLPPGYAVSVDNDTQEVVVTWPAYQAAAAPILNPSAESGDTGWLLGPGWSIASGNQISGTKGFRFANQGGSSVLANEVRYAISAGTGITASCQVRQGASSAGNAGACVRLEFRDAAGNELPAAEGNMVSSASNNAVKPSSLTTTAPAGTATVNIASRAFRKRQNRELWVDDFTWNVTVPSIGTNIEGQWPITLRVTDSLGRTAYFTGTIKVTVDVPWIVAMQGQGAPFPNGIGFITSPDGDDWSGALQQFTDHGISSVTLQAFGGSCYFNGGVLLSGRGLRMDGSHASTETYYTTDKAVTFTSINGGVNGTGEAASDLVFVGNGRIFKGAFWDVTYNKTALAAATSVAGPWTYTDSPAFEMWEIGAVKDTRLVIGWPSRDYVWVSDDNGATITKQATPVFGTNVAVVHLSADTSYFYACASGSNRAVRRSATGLSGSWSECSISLGTDDPYRIAAGENGVVVVACSNGRFYYSTDFGASFAPATGTLGSSPGSDNLLNCKFGAGRFIAVGHTSSGSPLLATTRDPAVWVQKALHPALALMSAQLQTAAQMSD